MSYDNYHKVEIRKKYKYILKNNKKNLKKIFGTCEWAKTNINFIDGCKNDCKYCYSKEMAIRFNRKTSTNWKDEHIRTHCLNKRYTKKEGTIMFPSAHDISPKYLSQTITVLKNLFNEDNRVLIVSKPHVECIKNICDIFHDYRNNILFRFTIGSANSNVLSFWEPGAPEFNERFNSLKIAFRKGFFTSVSCEPMLDDKVEKVIEKVMPYITDSIWIGKINYLLRRLKMNKADDKETMKKATEIIAWQSNNNNILNLYDKYKNNTKIKWKESIKSVVGLNMPTEKGLDQ